MKILATGKGLPKKIITNDDLSKIMDTNDEWITTRTGIKERRVLTDESLLDIAKIAVEKAIHKSDLNMTDIDMIIVTTLAGDNVTPSLACQIRNEYGISCPSFDINVACTGFIYALDMAEAYLQREQYKNILIVSAEAMSRMVDWNDRATCVLFGDGAGACIVTKGNNLKYMNISSSGNPDMLALENGCGNLPYSLNKDKNRGFLVMNGQSVFKFAGREVESQINMAFEKTGISAESINLILLHQANKRIIDYISSKLKVNPEKVPTNIETYANMSSASILVLLDDVLEAGKAKSGDNILLCAFGAGMTSGCCIIEI